MTPETAQLIGTLIERFGLPVVILAAFGWLILRRKLVTAGELADKQAESDGWRALYEREREDRIAAQKQLGEVPAAVAGLSDSVRGLAEDVVKRLPVQNVYEERLHGGR